MLFIQVAYLILQLLNAQLTLGPPLYGESSVRIINNGNCIVRGSQDDYSSIMLQIPTTSGSAPWGSAPQTTAATFSKADPTGTLQVATVSTQSSSTTARKGRFAASIQYCLMMSQDYLTCLYCAKGFALANNRNKCNPIDYGDSPIDQPLYSISSSPTALGQFSSPLSVQTTTFQTQYPNCYTYDGCGKCLSCLAGAQNIQGVCQPYRYKNLCRKSVEGLCLECGKNAVMLLSGRCKQVEPNCLRFNSNNECQQCLPGFNLMYFSCVNTRPLEFKYTDLNCQEWLNGTCLVCKSGWSTGSDLKCSRRTASIVINPSYPVGMRNVPKTKQVNLFRQDP